MSEASSQVTGLFRIPLGQRRFRSGALYIAGIHTRGDLEAIDVRYFVEEGNQLIPTRQGFRIHADNLSRFRNVLRTPEGDLEQAELWRGAARRLIARYCDDKYGTGVDIRYFSDSSRYTGWEPRGIRLQLEDFSKLRATLLDSGIVDGRISAETDLFSGKEIMGRTSRGRESDERSKGSVNQQKTGTQVMSTINEALKAYIDDL
jgi:hypothetical protein